MHRGKNNEKNTNMNRSLLSSQRMDWGTPVNVVRRIEAGLGIQFTLDPCATAESAKAPRHYTVTDDGLTKNWDEEVVFMNPPYGRAIGIWMKKARGTKGIVACLVPARTDTVWWHESAMRADLIYLIRGRIRFVGAADPAPFPSAVVVFSPAHRGFAQPDFRVMNIKRQ